MNADRRLRRGATVQVRAVRAGDLADVLALHERLSDRSILLRYLILDREIARRYVTSLAQPDERRRTLCAFTGDELVGVGSFERLEDDAAEFALLVEDACQHSGVGTLLIERLVAEARSAGVRRFVADLSASNAAALRVIRHLSRTPNMHTAYGETHVEFSLDASANG